MKKWAPLLWLAIVGIAMTILWERLQTIELADIAAELRSLPARTLALAIACCVASYTLVAIYEGIAVRFVSGRALRRHAFRTALIANPLGRVIGAAIVSGGALRYRMYNAADLPPRQIAAVIALVAMPYFLGVGWLVDIALLLSVDEAARALHLPVWVVVLIGVLGLAKDVGWIAFVHQRRAPIQIRGTALRLPSLPATLLQIAFGVTCVLLLATILYLLMPAEAQLSLPAFIAVYLIAVVAGQLSTVPAGLGVLEAALLLMLPQIPPAKLLGAVLAYRAIYELLPLAIALLLLLTFETADRRGALRARLTPRR